MSVAPEPTFVRQKARSVPRIYYLHPLLAPAIDRLIDELDHCLAMGFNTVLMPPPFQPGAGGSLFLTADHSALHPALGEGSADDYLTIIASACRARGLSLYLDLIIDRLAVSGIQATRRPEWFSIAQRDEGAGPDPRRPPKTRDIAKIRFDIAAVARAMTDWWSERIAAWLDLGILGFRCDGPQCVPVAVWRELMESARQRQPACRFLAWTPGLTPDEMEDLRACRFDAVFSSARWWDFRTDWLVEEHERLRTIAPSIAFPEAPFGARLAGELARPDERLPAYRRALWLAAFAGDGILIPMGFEYGAKLSLDVADDDPNALEAMRARAPFDISRDIAEANAWIAEIGEACDPSAMLSLVRSGGHAAALLRSCDENSAGAKKALLFLANASLHRSAKIDTSHLLMQAGLITEFEPAISITEPLTLAPGEVRVFSGKRPAPIIIASRGKRALEAASRAPRIAIENVEPSVDEGRFPAKRNVGERVTIEADIITDGHDELAANLVWRTADKREWNEARMTLVNNDRWRAELPLTRLGTYQFTIEAWRDDFSTLRTRLRKKIAAQVSLANEIDDAYQEIQEALKHASSTTATAIQEALTALNAAASEAERADILLADELADAMTKAAPRRFLYRHPVVFQIWAERLSASFASWYELFPRSVSGDTKRHGTFDDVIGRLPAIRSMGFDVLYMPPIHPIGSTNRKGRNNSLKAEPGEPGSPYATGSSEGGHTAIHPELGTLEDFRRLRDAARGQGIEIALDFAIQCSPDHPWLKERPDWFKWQSDGSLRYAENPPKIYEDITNVEFYADGAIPGLWLELENVVLFWIAEGVKIFRVDNPHTKPFPFWEWLIGDIRNRHPDVIFLAEAFTAPKRMNRLAKLGFSQSYTYFTWRHSKAELSEYLSHLANDDVRNYLRPHFFVNTPDINPHFLQTSGRAGHLIRAALATLTSGLWGMYNGFELCEATPLPGREEYLNSEKYEIRAWDWHQPENIISEITALNRIRKTNPALHSHKGITFYNAFNDQILYFAKATRNRDNVILAAINLDPFRTHEAAIELPLWEWGLPDDAALTAEDLMQGSTFEWRGKNQNIRLDPAILPFAVWRVEPAGGVL